MKTWQWRGPQDEVVPDMGAQDEHGGTLILRPMQTYQFEGDPPGNPAWWLPVPAPATKPSALPPPADSVTTD